MDIYAAGVISSRATLTERTVLMNFIRVISDSVVENDFFFLTNMLFMGCPLCAPSSQ